MKTIQVSLQEIWQQTKSKIHKSKKIYSRKNNKNKKEFYER
jgi:hypothetical protein